MTEPLNVKPCGVCGERANCRNFGAISCESCKAFFRRALTKTKTTKISKCSFNNKCVIDVNNRKSCKKCRLDKCLAIGMKKELIKLNSDEERGEHSSANQPNDYLESHHLDICSTDHSSQDSHNSAVFTDSCLDSVSVDNELDFIFDKYCADEEDMSFAILEAEELFNDLDETGITDSISSLVPVVRPIATYNKPFNEIEMSRIQELLGASDLLLAFRGSDNVIEVKGISEMFEQMGIHDLMGPMIKQMIGFCKNMSLFQQNCEQDRLTLFKSNCLKILSISQLHESVYDRVSQNFTYQFENHTLKLNSFHLQQENQQLFKMGLSFFQAVSDDLMKDRILINLLMAIVLFSYDSPGLIHKDNIKLHQQMYFYLLQRYLTQKYRSEDKVSQSLAETMNVPITLITIDQVSRQMASNFQHCFSPLLREVFGFQ